MGQQKLTAVALSMKNTAQAIVCESAVGRLRDDVQPAVQAADREMKPTVSKD
jgi:hypothetical protein